jgi:hypothetical protein
MKTLSFWLLGASLFGLSLTPAGGQEAAYVGIPAGFDFPASEAELLAAVNSGNETRLREHAWKVFAGLTQPARPQDANSEAVWETWYTGAETFASGPSPQGVRSLKKELRLPRQFQPLERGPAPQAVGESQLSGTLFNHELRKHTKDNGLTSQAKLIAINTGWTNQTPVADRKVTDYPPKAMSLKLVWLPVRQQGTSTLPIWDEQPIVSQAPAQDTNTWKRVVVVDPRRETIPADETATGRWLGRDFPRSRVVPSTTSTISRCRLIKQRALALTLGITRCWSPCITRRAKFRIGSERRFGGTISRTTVDSPKAAWARRSSREFGDTF